MKQRILFLWLMFFLVGCIETNTELTVEEKYETDTSKTKVVTNFNLEDQSIQTTTTTISTFSNGTIDENVQKKVQGLDCESVSVIRYYGEDYPNRIVLGENIQMNFSNLSKTELSNLKFRTVVVSYAGDTVQDYFCQPINTKLNSNSDIDSISFLYKVRPPISDYFPENKYSWTTQIIDTLNQDTLSGTFDMFVITRMGLTDQGPFEYDYASVYDLDKNEMLFHDTLSPNGNYGIVLYGLSNYDPLDDKAYFGAKFKLFNQDKKYIYKWVEHEAKKPQGFLVSEISDSLIIPIEIFESDMYTDLNFLYIKLWDNVGFRYLELSYNFRVE